MPKFNYLFETIPGDLDVRYQFKLAVNALLLTGFSVVAVHQFLSGEQPWVALMLHALFIAATYTGALVLLGVLLFFFVKLKGPGASIAVWQAWCASFVAFNIGFFLELPGGPDLRSALHADAASVDESFHYFRLLPIWGLITWVFIQTYLKQGLENEVRQLRAIQEKLANRHKLPAPSSTGEQFCIEAGKNTITLEADSVSHVSVIDHYSYVHYFENGEWRKNDLAMPLRRLAEELPENFVQIHRSHVVNPARITALEKDGRSWRVTMENGEVLPVSRNLSGSVLPKLEHAL